MPVIEVSLKKHQNKTDARGNQNAFFEWCDNNGLGKEGFDVCVRSEETWKGKNITYFIASYGSFETLEGWIVYISYRGDILNVVRYHTWKWEKGGAILASHKLDKFANI